MLAAARNVLVTRPGLWVAAVACAALAALPQAVAATVGAAGGVAFLLTGDLALALEIWEHTPGLSGGLVPAGVVALVLGFAAWVRLEAIAIRLSRPEEPETWREARLSTRPTWRRALLLHLHAYAGLALAAVVLSLTGAVTGPVSFGTSILLAAVVFLVARTLVRIVLSIALRAVLLDGLSSLQAWRSAWRFVRARRHDVAVAWVGLVAIGVSVWLVGRLVTPVLQDTALDYPATSGYEIARQAIQFLVSVPLEAALLGLGIAVWTAVYDGVETRPEERAQRRGPDPWVRKALLGGLAIALVGNGLTTVVDDSFRRARAEEESRIAAADLKPEEVTGSAVPPPPADDRTSYRVEATLDGDELAWVTVIDYVNATDEPLRDLRLNVYANAYARPLRDIPFARDLFASDFNGEFQALARPGEMRVFEVAVDGRDVDAELRDTALVIDLPAPIAPRERTEIEIDIEMDLPRFPERFGRWEELTLLGNWIPSVAVRDAGEWRVDPFGAIGDPFLSDVADYDVAIAVDENESVVGTGTLDTVVERADGTREWRFDAPAVRDAAFASAPFLRGLETDAGGTVVRSWYAAGEGRRGAANLGAAASAASYFSDRYGELPWPEVDVVETEGRLGGMEYPGVVFVSSASEAFAGLPLVPELVAYSGFDEARSRYVVAHEVAHQWWFAAVGSDQIREPWLDEGLAEASTRLWLSREDDGERTWLMTNLVAEADAAPAAVRAGIADFTSNERYAETVYLQGSQVLMELRRAVGATTYDAILREWYESNVLEIATIDAFADTVARVGGRRGAAFADEYL